MPNFTKNEFVLWMHQNNVYPKWLDYIESDYDINKKPSVDRIDDYKGYSFDNMQLITWKENRLKGVNSEKHHKACHNRQNRKSVKVINWQGEIVKVLDSLTDCAEYLGVHLVSVSRVLNGSRKTIKGYRIALTGEELTIKD
ncbi:unnamed protein product [marine sediment metagenome]|uniref:DNA endonuclease I-HmuI-like NUMOD-like domain-containing protein n=1 Tax=marine sediment metagenome TaxID=412755 RepID=X0VUJ3_9ZZZZ